MQFFRETGLELIPAKILVSYIRIMLDLESHVKTSSTSS